jgi:hypothetical protein
MGFMTEVRFSEWTGIFFSSLPPSKRLRVHQQFYTSARVMAAISSDEKLPELEPDYTPPTVFLLLSSMALPAHSGLLFSSVIIFQSR